jgi:hypothetical protein
MLKLTSILTVFLLAMNQRDSCCVVAPNAWAKLCGKTVVCNVRILPLAFRKAVCREQNYT